jgi:phosphatidylinositol alpha 1,6-mannosyltransferase
MLPDLYANCDAFVFASTTETLGLVVLEAMASGLPVIASPEGGVADHLRDGVNGLEFPAGDARALATAMLHLVADPVRAMRLGAGARTTAESLSWESELDRLDASMLEVLRTPQPSSRRWKPAAHRRASAELTLGGHATAVRFDEVLDDR